MSTERLTVHIRVQKRLAATCECKATFKPRDDGSFELSPHLRDTHGFTDAPIDFAQVSESICPPMIFMEARQ